MSDATPTRRRAEVLETAIREAVRAELDAHGFAGVTFEGVARQARTSKPVLYRRYACRAQMVADAIVTALSELPDADGDTGTLRGDLIHALSLVVQQIERVGPDTFRGLLGEADPETLSRLARRIVPTVASLMGRCLDRAVARGEIGAGTVPTTALLAPVALLRVESLQAPDVLTPEHIVEVVDAVALPLILAHAETAEPVGADLATVTS